MQMGRKVVILLIVGVWTAASTGSCAQQDEPLYGGVPLTTLLENAAHRLIMREPTLPMHNGGWVRDPEAENAVRNIGTNALPYLIDMVRDESPLRADLAVNAFRLLGPKATPAIPELEKIALLPSSGAVGSHAVQALGYIGSNALPSLDRLSTNSETRVDAVVAIVELGSEGVMVEPTLMAILKPGDMAAEMAVMGLRHFQASNAIPILTKVLQHSKAPMRKDAAEVIRWFGVQARPAVPGLTQCLYDPDAGVRQTSTEVLRRLAPEMFVTNSSPNRAQQ